MDLTTTEKQNEKSRRTRHGRPKNKKQRDLCNESSSNETPDSPEIRRLRERIRQNNIKIENSTNEWNSFCKETEASLQMWREHIDFLLNNQSKQAATQSPIENLSDQENDGDDEYDIDDDEGEDILEAEEATQENHSETNLSLDAESEDSFTVETASHLSSQATLTDNPKSYSQRTKFFSKSQYTEGKEKLSLVVGKTSSTSLISSHVSSDIQDKQNAKDGTVKEHLNNDDDDSSTDEDESRSLKLNLEGENSYQSSSDENSNDGSESELVDSAND